MNHSRYMIDSRRSPYPRRRKSLVPRSPELANSLPAITLLEPNGYRLEPRAYSPNRFRPEENMTPRPLSPGAFRIAPPRSAKNKISSFVILHENVASPVTSRSPSPSGRVSPFRGHGFKSPTTSRPTSRAASPTQPSKKKSAVKILPLKPEIKDIGLPPKSPKRVVKSVQIKEFKPALKPKPILINNNNKNKVVINKSIKLKDSNTKKNMVMTTVDKNKDKKPPVPPKKTDIEKSKPGTDEGQMNSQEKGKEESAGESRKADEEEPKVVSEEKIVGPSEKDTAVDGGKVDKEERLIPCFQPDKCHIVPPTMASPSQTIATSTTTVPSTSSESSRVATSRMSAISSALSATDTLARKSLSKPITAKISKPPVSPLIQGASNSEVNDSPNKVESVVTTMTTVDDVIKSRLGSASSRNSEVIGSPTLSERTRSSMVTVRAISNGSLRGNDDTILTMPHIDTGDVISSTKLIVAEPDLEVLSPNNLLHSARHDGREPLWEDGRVSNGQAANSTPPKGRCARFTSAIWRFITYIFCCCKRWTCCQSGTSWKCNNCCSCCRKSSNESSPESRCSSCHCSNPFSFLKTCFQKLNCCKNLKCSPCCKSACCQKPFCKKCSPCCGKLKCCEGKSCCKRAKTKEKKAPKSVRNMCCAKGSCSCKNCCSKVKDCCKSCNDKVNSCCRALFCLNLMCCQRCLRKCTCCHKFKCCQKGGCCSCCNPNVKREQRTRLDKKTSRASNKSNQALPKLDAALVEHSSVMKAAIPVLPACLAWFCLILNFLIPGSGTLMSGILCLCFGKPRFSVNDSPKNRFSAFLVDLVIAVSQAFTIIFCLVGWGWSMWWGVIMVKLARKQKRLRIAEKNQEATPSTGNQNHIDAERGEPH